MHPVLLFGLLVGLLVLLRKPLQRLPQKPEKEYGG
jgi:hypothetical protein